MVNLQFYKMFSVFSPESENTFAQLSFQPGQIKVHNTSKNKAHSRISRNPFSAGLVASTCPDGSELGLVF